MCVCCSPPTWLTLRLVLLVVCVCLCVCARLLYARACWVVSCESVRSERGCTCKAHLFFSVMSSVFANCSASLTCVSLPHSFERKKDDVCASSHSAVFSVSALPAPSLQALSLLTRCAVLSVLVFINPSICLRSCQRIRPSSCFFSFSISFPFFLSSSTSSTSFDARPSARFRSYSTLSPRITTPLFFVMYDQPSVSTKHQRRQ